MKLNRKKKNELYKCVSDEIMDARIKVNVLIKNNTLTPDNLDNILYGLSVSAPKKALELFDN